MPTPLVLMAVLAALVGLLVGVRALQVRGVVGAEPGRKIVHVGMALLCLPLPWLVPRPGPVWLLGLLATALLLAIRLVPALNRHYGGVLGGVSRRSWGDIAFPPGLVLAFALAHDHPAAFCAGAAVLALGDTAGAVVGQRWGQRRYAVPGGTKSLEGSAAVGLVSAGCIAAAALAVGGLPWPEAATAGLTLGAAALVIEAGSPLGLDNLTLPPAVAWLVLLWTEDSAWRGAGLGLAALAVGGWAFATRAAWLRRAEPLAAGPANR